MTSSSVSILVPTYEPDPDFLREALASIQAQTFKDWTVLIHDDASDSDVRAFVEPFLKDHRFTFVRSPKRLGIGGNWNTCLKQVLHPTPYPQLPTPYIQFLFQDDLWHPEYLEKSVSILNANPSAGFVASNHDYLYSTGSSSNPIYGEVAGLRHSLPSGKYSGKEFLQQWLDRGLRPNIIGEPSFVMMRAAEVSQAGPFREDLKQGLDMEYWIRLLLRTDWYFVAESMGTFRVHEKSASQSHDFRSEGLFDRLACFETLLSGLRGSDRRKAAGKFVTEIAFMMKKYKVRATERSNSTEGKPAKSKKLKLRFWAPLIGFSLRHPLLMLRAWLRS